MARKSEQSINTEATNSIELVVNVSFSDKYDLTKHYRTGDVITVNETRAKELLADKRNLVSKA